MARAARTYPNTSNRCSTYDGGSEMIWLIGFVAMIVVTLIVLFSKI